MRQPSSRRSRAAKSSNPKEEVKMTTTQTTTASGSAELPETVDQQIAKMRELFADAPEVGKKALENVLTELTSQAEDEPPPPVESAGRVGIRLGKVSELTILVPLAPGGAERTRA